MWCYTTLLLTCYTVMITCAIYICIKQTNLKKITILWQHKWEPIWIKWWWCWVILPVSIQFASGSIWLKLDLYLHNRIENLITPRYWSCSVLIILTNQIVTFMWLKVFRKPRPFDLSRQHARSGTKQQNNFHHLKQTGPWATSLTWESISNQ